jgi:hypothetical protein
LNAEGNLRLDRRSGDEERCGDSECLKKSSHELNLSAVDQPGCVSYCTRAPEHSCESSGPSTGNREHQPHEESCRRA